MSKPTCVELFAGAGGASLGLHRAGYRSLLAAEWDPNACETHRVMLKSPVFEGDVRKLDAELTFEKPPHLMWASPPCFPPGTPVVTSEGWKPIEDLVVGDLVLTHQGRYRRVEETMSRPYKGNLMRLSLRYGRRDIVCTPEHPFYARRRERMWNKDQRLYGWIYSKPEWVSAFDLTKEHLLLKPATQAWVPVKSCVVEDIGDVTTVHNLEVQEDHSYVVFGVAAHNCQAFSSAGKRLGAMDDRNGWPWTLDILDRMQKRVCRPTWVICENVPGLTHHKGDCPQDPDADPFDCPGCYWERWIIPEFKKRFAHVSVRMVDASDFGVPQRRKRIFLLAGPEPYLWPKPSHSFHNLVHDQWVTGTYWRQHGLITSAKGPSVTERKLLESIKMRMGGPEEGVKPWVTVRDALDLDLPIRHGDGNDAPHYWLKQDVPMVIRGGTNPHGSGREAERTHRDITDEPSTTIATSSGGGAGNAGPWIVDSAKRTQEDEHKEASDNTEDFFDFLGEDKEVSPFNGSQSGGLDRSTGGVCLATGRRRLTVGECAVLQGFPTDYDFQGTKTSQYKQVGNAVCPQVAEALARMIPTGS